MLLCLPLLLGFAAVEAQAQTATLSISPPADANEGSSGTRDLFVTVTLSAGVSQTTGYQVCFTGTASIDTTQAGTIPDAADYQPIATIGGTTTPWAGNCITTGFIASNQTNASFPIGIRVKGDTDAESDETVIATLSFVGSAPSGVTLGTSTATYTILDDDTPAPEISVELPISESESRTDAGEKKVSESEGGVGIGFPLSANQPLPSALTVCVRVTESGGDRVASGNEGIQTVSMPSSGLTNGSGTHTLTWTNTAADDRDSSVTVEVVAPNTASCSADNDSYTVSSSDASDKLLIQDDESTTVSLTSTDMTMTEGDASDTATLTVSLSRRLYAGEVIVVPLTLASSTGARLPGSTNSGTANHDFTVAASGTDVTLANALTATPSLTFTGHGINTVQTATVTLTPVANRDDGNMAHETITATLATNSVLGATGTGTTVSGGVSRHASNYMATLMLEDDEAVPAGTPGITLSTPGPLRLLETGTATYTVALNAAPTADVEVSFSRIGQRTSDRDADIGAVNPNIPSLTFTTMNWSEPQMVTVTGVDESGTHRNRTLLLVHSLLSTDLRYNSLSVPNLRVNVDDAPEVEAWWDFKGRLGPHPSTLNLAGEGNPEANQNAAPFTRMSYAVRLSNRPKPGGTVTVTATVPADKRHLISLSLNGSWPWRSSVDVEFKDRDPGAGTGCSNWHGLRKNEYFDSSGNKQTVTGGSNSETWDNSPDTPWKCWRRIYVLRSGSRNVANTCVDITHTATGGGVRRVAIDTVRAHIINSGSGRKCEWLTGNTLPQNSPAQAASAPTEAVSNLQVTAVDATSASVTWDAVANATSYDVSWSAESSDSQNASAGALPGVTGTSATIEHDASVPMTLTVTVTPEYIDENGVTQQLNALAGTATLAIGPSGQRLDSGGGTNGGNGGSIDAGYGAVDLPVPVSHWRFEYDAVDWVGSSHGTESGGVAFEANEEGEGVEDHALSLDGSDDYVDLSTHVSDFPLGDSTRSVTGWFKADAGNQGQTFFAYGPNVAGKRFSIAADRTQVLVAVSGHAWGVNGLELQEGWHHVAVTYAGGDSDDILIYLDGELQSASTLVGSPKRLNTGTGPAAIGRSVNGKNHYAGLIDDVRLYDVALSAEQVLALFEEHSQTPLAEDNQDEPEPSEQSIEADDEEADDGAVDLPDPVSHWSFDNNVVDGAGSSHGTVSGGVAFAANEDGEGVGSHALSLDGSNDHVDLDLHVSNFPLGDSTRSVTGWFKADTGNQGQTFLSYGPNVAGKRFSIAADRTQVLVGVSGHAWGVNGLNLTDGWHHVAVTYAGGKSDAVLIYLDGELQSALTLVGSPKRLNTGTGPAAIGQNVGGTKHYAGSIDDVRLYDVALSAEQVRALFDEHPQL